MKCLKFSRRPPEIANDEENRLTVLARLEALGKEVEFGLASGICDADTGIERDDELLPHGLTVGRRIWRKTKCWISFELIEPLFNQEITDAERMLTWYSIANVVVHELVIS